ncbi:MAG: hypothetical protein H6948_14865 [Zoogloeaceae bacterium]|nr:hypothetical protein [Zoogloeaceae bacterium]
MTFLNDRKVQEPEVRGTRRGSASQRQEPVGVVGRTHGKRHQADVHLLDIQISDELLYALRPGAPGRTSRRPMAPRIRPVIAHWGLA